MLTTFPLRTLRFCCASINWVLPEFSGRALGFRGNCVVEMEGRISPHSRSLKLQLFPISLRKFECPKFRFFFSSALGVSFCEFYFHNFSIFWCMAWGFLGECVSVYGRINANEVFLSFQVSQFSLRVCVLLLIPACWFTFAMVAYINH